MLHNLRFYFSSKCRLFHNATLFGSCIIRILPTGNFGLCLGVVFGAPLSRHREFLLTFSDFAWGYFRERLRGGYI